MSHEIQVRSGEHTWPEVGAALDDGTRTAVVAVGSVEQHRPHSPLLMDTLAGEELSERTASAYADEIESRR